MGNKNLTDENLQKAFDELQGKGHNVQFVELDDEIEFNCSRCGSCCTNRGDILLSPYDVHNLAVALGITGREIVNTYCEVYIGHNSHLPVVVIADTPDGKCPFLKFDAGEMLYGCTVNSHKPGPCKTHPFGIVRTLNASDLEPDEIRFIKTDFCDKHSGGTKKTVKEFIGEEYLNSLELRKISYKMQSFVTKTLNLKKIHAIIDGDSSFEGFTEKERNMLSNLSEQIRDSVKMVYCVPYLEAIYNLSPDKTFLEQSETCFKNLVRSSIETRALLCTLGFDIGPENEDECENLMNQYITGKELSDIIQDLDNAMSKAKEHAEKLIKEKDADVNTTGN